MVVAHVAHSRAGQVAVSEGKVAARNALPEEAFATAVARAVRAAPARGGTAAEARAAEAAKPMASGTVRAPDEDDKAPRRRKTEAVADKASGMVTPSLVAAQPAAALAGTHFVAGGVARDGRRRAMGAGRGNSAIAVGSRTGGGRAAVRRRGFAARSARSAGNAGGGGPGGGGHSAIGHARAGGERCGGDAGAGRRPAIGGGGLASRHRARRRARQPAGGAAGAGEQRAARAAGGA